MNETLRCGRLELAVKAGTQPTLFIHEIAAPRDVRHAEMTANQQHHGAWVYDQRGHGRSSWSAGGAYQLVDFAMDLAVLCERIGEPVAVIADGASGFSAVLAASAHPDRIQSITWRYFAQGWSQLIEHFIGNAWLPNQIWLESVAHNFTTQHVSPAPHGATVELTRQLRASAATGTTFDCDPQLLLGPPDVLNRKHLRDAFDQLERPLHMSDGEVAEKALYELLAHRSDSAEDAHRNTHELSPTTRHEHQRSTSSTATVHAQGES